MTKQYLIHRLPELVSIFYHVVCKNFFCWPNTWRKWKVLKISLKTSKDCYAKLKLYCLNIFAQTLRRAMWDGVFYCAFLSLYNFYFFNFQLISRLRAIRKVSQSQNEFFDSPPSNPTITTLLQLYVFFFNFPLS